MGEDPSGAAAPLAARVRVVGRGERRLVRFLCGNAGPCPGRLHDHRPRLRRPPPPPLVVCPVCAAPNALPWPVEPGGA